MSPSATKELTRPTQSPGVPLGGELPLEIVRYDELRVAGGIDDLALSADPGRANSLGIT